jgi:hypothetical protein
MYDTLVIIQPPAFFLSSLSQIKKSPTVDVPYFSEAFQQQNGRTSYTYRCAYAVVEESAWRRHIHLSAELNDWSVRVTASMAGKIRHV